MWKDKGFINQTRTRSSPYCTSFLGDEAVRVKSSSWKKATRLELINSKANEGKNPNFRQQLIYFPKQKRSFSLASPEISTE